VGLKGDLLDALTLASAETGQSQPDISDGSFAERYAQYQTEAIVKFLTEADFTITQLKAPVTVESLKTPDQPVNIELETLLGEYQPLLKVLKKIGDPLGLGSTIDKLEGEIEKAISKVLEGGAKLTGLDLGKDAGGLECVGYVFIGDEPDSVDSIDVSDEQGQTANTTVKLIPNNIEDLL
jgi:hypothetical protein|tara:strand:+ start:319 stop:858 length:540 start_codon:yes stop_codon:yes gene_type:complete